MEHITPPEDVRVNPHCDRIISLYGYMHGVGLKPNSKVHIPGNVIKIDILHKKPLLKDIRMSYNLL